MPRRKGRGKGEGSAEMRHALADLEKDVEAAQRHLKKAQNALQTAPVAQKTPAKPVQTEFDEQVELLKSMRASCASSITKRADMMRLTVADIKATRGRLSDTALLDEERAKLNARLRDRLEEAKKIPGDLDTAVDTLRRTWTQKINRLREIDAVRAAPLVAKNIDQMTDWVAHARLTQTRLHETVARLLAPRASSGFYLGTKLRAGTQW